MSHDPWAFNHFEPDDDGEAPPAAQRERDDPHPSRYHWCDLCQGFTGPGSPCYVGPEDQEATDV